MSAFVTEQQLTAAGTIIGARIKSAVGGSRYPAGLVANRVTEFYTAFLSTTPWDSFFAGAVSGSGSTATLVNVDTILNDATYVRIETGTTPAGRANISNGVATFRARAGQFHKFKTRVVVSDVASNATDTYEVIIGFVSTATAVAPYAACFRIATSGVLQAVTRNNATETITVLDTPIVGAADTYEVIINGADDVNFYINGVLVASHSTTLPTSAFMLCNVSIRKTLGSVNRRLRAYFMALQSTMP